MSKSTIYLCRGAPTPCVCGSAGLLSFWRHSCVSRVTTGTSSWPHNLQHRPDHRPPLQGVGHLHRRQWARPSLKKKTIRDWISQDRDYDLFICFFKALYMVMLQSDTSAWKWNRLVALVTSQLQPQQKKHNFTNVKQTKRNASPGWLNWSKRIKINIHTKRQWSKHLKTAP